MQTLWRVGENQFARAFCNPAVLSKDQKYNEINCFSFYNRRYNAEKKYQCKDYNSTQMPIRVVPFFSFLQYNEGIE